MTRASDLLDRTPADLGDVDREKLVGCIEACLDCAQACTACAASCLAEPAESLGGLATCVRTQLDCADVCAATARVLSRTPSPVDGLAAAMLSACLVVCRGCREECERCGAGDAGCQVCAEACARCERSCADLLDSMR